MFDEMNRQMAETPQWVQYWMNWMMVIFLSAIFFVKNHKAPRYALAALLATMVLGMFIFYLHPNVHLLGLAHIILWAPLLVYLKKNVCDQARSNPFQPYSIWVFLLAATIITSLVFDVRDIYLVLRGQK